MVNLLLFVFNFEGMQVGLGLGNESGLEVET
jgi:hypothetical protein